MVNFNFKNLFDFEKKSIFLINFLMILLVIYFILFDYSLEYFFYFNIFSTLILSYFLFKKSKKLSKQLIVTNMFIFFYFLYPKISYFFTEMFGAESYIFILFYNVLIAYLFLYLSGNHKNFIGNWRKFNLKLFSLILILGFVFGLLFRLIKEPVPAMFLGVSDMGVFDIFKFLIFSSFIVAFSEQMIFSGFLFNVYSKLTSKFDAFFQVSIIFVLFHLLRFEILVKHYFAYFNDLYILYISVYYLLLFLFMISSLYFYSLKNKKYSGNFLYPVAFHFAADLGLFIFTIFGL